MTSQRNLDEKTEANISSEIGKINFTGNFEREFIIASKEAKKPVGFEIRVEDQESKVIILWPRHRAEFQSHSPHSSVCSISLE
jgi:hypothetical protein